MTLERRALKGTLVGILAVILNAIATFVLVPTLLGAWGASRYGAWLALQALLALVETLDSGHQNFVGNELAKLYFGERPALRIVLASAIWAAVMIGGVELLIVLGLSAANMLPVAFGLPDEVIASERLYLALILSSITWMLTGSVGGILARLMLPAGMFVRAGVWGIVLRVTQTAGICCAALGGLGILGTTIVSQVMVVLYYVALWRDFRRQFSDLWPMHRAPRISVGVRNFSRSLLMTGSATLAQLQQNGLNLLVIGALGAAALPVFSTARTVSFTFFQAAVIVCAPLGPEMVRFHVGREYAKLTATFAANWFLGASAIQIGILLSLPVLGPLYLLWTRHALPLDRGLFALLALSVALRALGSPLQTYIFSINHLRAYTVINTAQTVAVIATAAIGMHRLGLRAAAIGVLAGEVVGSCLLPLAFVAFDLPAAWRPRLFRHAAFAVAPTLVTSVALFFYARHTPDLVVVSAALIAIIPLLWAQWRELPSEVRTRLFGLLPRLAVHRRSGG
jgi:O-antigen/teichoic acid export membrane protein